MRADAETPVSASSGMTALRRGLASGLLFAASFCAGVAIVAAGVAWGVSSLIDASGQDEFIETFVGGTENADAAKVVRIEIMGEIGHPAASSPMDNILNNVTGTGGKGSNGDVEAFYAVRERVRLATVQKDVKGLFIVIDSPGGDLVDSDMLWHDVTLFRKAQPGRFVFVHALAQCCSGAYYVASAADSVMVLPSGVVGSIGVIADYGVNVSELAKRFGISSMVVSTGTHKDVLNPFKPVDASQMAVEKRIVECQFARFIDAVAQGRGMPVDKVRALADGRTYAAPDALANGLVDAIGYDDDALAKLEELAGGEVCVVAYDEPSPGAMERIVSVFKALRAHRRSCAPRVSRHTRAVRAYGFSDSGPRASD